MATIAGDPVRTLPDPGYRGLLEFAERVGLKLEPFQRKILRAVLGEQAETLILLPRGAGKTTLMALVVVHHLFDGRGREGVRGGVLQGSGADLV